MTIYYKHIEKIGKVFYLEEAEPYISPSGKKYRKALFLCRCGKKFISTIARVKHGDTQSCGCYHDSFLVKHKMSRTRIYNIWRHMKERCDNPKCPTYKYYGGRKITYCKKWRNFKGFYADMQETYKENLEIDRINNNGNYTKKNCRWTTRTIQMRNRRKMKNNISGYVGVCFCKARKNWSSQININNCAIHLGHFKTAIEAAKVRDKYVISNMVEGFNLNFPELKYRSV